MDVGEKCMLDESVGKSGRENPYTLVEISDVGCFRCGAPASTQWQICSDGGIYRPLCKWCDIELNKICLEFLGFKDVDEKMLAYFCDM